MSCGPRLLQFAQQLADRRIFTRGFQYEVFKVFGNEQVVNQRFLDTFGDLCALFLQALDAEQALAWIGEVPAMQDGEAVKTLLQNVAKFALVLGMQLFVFRAADDLLPSDQGAR